MDKEIFCLILLVSLTLVTSGFKIDTKVKDEDTLVSEGDLTKEELKNFRRALIDDPSTSAGDQITAINEAEDVNLFESDIELTGEQKEEELSHKRNAVRNRDDIWRTKRVPYLIDQELINIGFKPKIEGAIADFDNFTCIRWVPKTLKDDTWVMFKHLTGCYSALGKGKKGQQTISLGNGCGGRATILHEMCHTLGFRHEQSRYDRDQYLEVLWENITPGKASNFNKKSLQITEDSGTPYDTRSLMQYGKRSFSKNGRPTLQVIGDPDRPLGQRIGFSKIDLIQLNDMYDCSKPLGGWSSWSDFAPCLDSCKKSRQRFCTNENRHGCGPGANKRGVQTETVDCPQAECLAPRAGHWGRWSSWQSCSVTCGMGTKLRTRECNDPPPKNGGAACVGSRQSTSKCLLLPCNAGPDDCDFTHGFCDWSNDPTSSATAWKRGLGATETENTGPPEESEDGYYIYYDASDSPNGEVKQSKGDFSRLISKKFPATTGRCMMFRYNMYGEDMGALRISVQTRRKKIVWNKRGDQGMAWKQGYVTIKSPKPYHIRIEAVRGNGHTGDIAMDEITFTEIACPL